MSTRIDNRGDDSANVPIRTGACIILGVIGVAVIISLIIGFGHMVSGGGR